MEHVEPILRALSVEGGYVHVGPPGSGHFAKLVRNDIEFGMLQAIGEGIDLLERYHEELPVADALQLETPIPVIAQSVMQLFASRDDRRNWARAVAMMRHGFGGHPYGEDDAIKGERREGRVGEIYRGEE